MDFDDPIERRKWLARLVASAKGHARKAGRPFEQRLSSSRPYTASSKGAATLQGIDSTSFASPMPWSSTPSRPASIESHQAAATLSDNVRLVCVAVNFGMGQWGEEVFLTLAQAAVEREKQRITEPDNAWRARYAERIAAAETLLKNLPESERPKQRRHIASLRRAMTLGPQGLKAAADKAKKSRSELVDG